MSDHLCSCGTCDKTTPVKTPMWANDATLNLGLKCTVTGFLCQTNVTNKVGCLYHPKAREYLNKEVIEELEYWISGLEYPDCPPGDAYARVIKLLKEDVKK